MHADYMEHENSIEKMKAKNDDAGGNRMPESHMQATHEKTIKWNEMILIGNQKRFCKTVLGDLRQKQIVIGLIPIIMDFRGICNGNARQHERYQK